MVVAAAVLVGCATVRSTVPASWHCVAERGSERIVLFVHGLVGDAEGTWRNTQTGAYWPGLLAADPKMAPFDVCVANYASPILGRASTIEEIAQRMLQQLRDRGIFTRYRQIHFITHSMGGLVVKRVLTVLYSPGEIEKLRLVRTVLFISTPAQGAPVADLASWISLNPQMRDLVPADLNSFLQSLENQWEFLLQDRDTRSGAFPRVYCAYETLPTAGVMVVSRVYASSRCDPPRYPVDLDHNAIVKPGSREDEPYPWARARILETAAMSPAAVAPAQGDVEGLQSQVAKLVRFPNATPDESKASTLIEQMLRNRLPLRLFDLLAKYDEGDRRGSPLLQRHFNEYYKFRQRAIGLEDRVTQRIGQMVVVRFRAGWRIYLRYAILRFSGQSKDQIVSGGDFLNYDITWDDAERVFGELARDRAVKGEFTELFAMHQRLIENVRAIEASLPT
jgi:hypothetical protein